MKTRRKSQKKLKNPKQIFQSCLAILTVIYPSSSVINFIKSFHISSKKKNCCIEFLLFVLLILIKQFVTCILAWISMLARGRDGVEGASIPSTCILAILTTTLQKHLRQKKKEENKNLSFQIFGKKSC